MAVGWVKTVARVVTVVTDAAYATVGAEATLSSAGAGAA